MAETRRRVLYLDHCARDSGAELTLLNLTRSLTRYVPVVVLGEDGPLVGRLRGAGVEVHVVPLAARTRDSSRSAVGALGGMPAKVLDAAGYAWRLRREIRRHRPDLVHTNSMKSHVLGGLGAALAGRRIVAHVHDRISTDFMSGGGVRLIHLVLRGSAAAVVSNSRSTEATVPAGVLSRRPSVVLASPVEPPEVRAEQPPDGAGGLRFGIVGRITPWKGQDVVLRAFAAAFGPDSPHRLLVVGAPQFGEDDYLGDLERLVTELGLTGRVEFTGHVTDVYATMARLHVLVHGSVIPEPFGMVIAQGLAVGLAVVAAGEGGPAEVITDRVDGLLYRPREVGSLADALGELAGDDGLRRRIAAVGPDTASSYFCGPVTAELEDFYDRVLGLPTDATDATDAPVETVELR